MNHTEPLRLHDLLPLAQTPFADSAKSLNFRGADPVTARITSFVRFSAPNLMDVSMELSILAYSSGMPEA
jgi:hypothetical protein